MCILPLLFSPARSRPFSKKGFFRELDHPGKQKKPYPPSAGDGNKKTIRLSDGWV
jgi:hypothetical protein